MTPDTQRPPLPQWLSARPWPLLAGVLAGFLACVGLGRSAAETQPYHDFVRFHLALAPEAHFYPTYSQVRNIALEKWSPGKVVVIVGGNSILHGVGQRRDHVWTHELQRLLGEKFVVTNLAMRGQFPFEFSAVVAERLAAEGVPVVYITNGIQVPRMGVEWDGGVYNWLFWDAWGKGQLPADPRRDAWLATHTYRPFREADPRLERRLRGMVDGAAFAQDLWTLIAYQQCSTVFSVLTRPHVLAPRSGATDNDPGATTPFELRFNDGMLARELANLRGEFAGMTLESLAAPDSLRKYADGHDEYLPELLRPRTVFVLRMEAPYVRDRLGPEERPIYDKFFEVETAAFQSHGLNAVLVGQNYVVEDFYDRSHISEQGGVKLAADVVDTVRAVGERLYPELFVSQAGARP